MKVKSQAIEQFKQKYPYFDFSDNNVDTFAELWDSCGLNESGDITLENLEAVATYGIEAGVLNPAINPSHMSGEELEEHMRRINGAEVDIPDPLSTVSNDELREYLDSQNQDAPVWDGCQWTRNQ